MSIFIKNLLYFFKIYFLTNIIPNNDGWEGNIIMLCATTGQVIMLNMLSLKIYFVWLAVCVWLVLCITPSFSFVFPLPFISKNRFWKINVWNTPKQKEDKRTPNATIHRRCVLLSANRTHQIKISKFKISRWLTNSQKNRSLNSRRHSPFSIRTEMVSGEMWVKAAVSNEL